MEFREFAILAVVASLALPNPALEAFSRGDVGVDRSDGDRDHDEGGDDCAQRGPAVPLPATKLIIEHNATDEDTGVHGLFDGVDWKTLCVYDPRGRLILQVDPERQLRTQSIS